jgi:tetratricopeptide (TPR) repeat protein
MTDTEFVLQMMDLANEVVENKLEKERAYKTGLKLLSNSGKMNPNWLFVLDKAISDPEIISPPNAFVLANLNYRFAQRIKDEELLGFCTLTYGKMSVRENKLNLAKKLLAQAQSIFDRLARTDGLMVTAGQLGELYKKSGNLRQAEKKYNIALEMAREASSISSEIAILNNLALLYEDFQNSSKAEMYYQRALRLARKYTIKPLHLKIFENMASFYREIRHFEKARNCLSQAIAIARTLEEKEEAAKFIMKSGSMYMEWEYLEQAVIHFQEAGQLAEDIENKDILILITGNLGLAFSRMAKWKEADSTYKRALQLVRQYKRQDYEIMILNNIGYYYLDRGNPLRALEQHQKAYFLSKTVGRVQDQIECLTNIAHAEMLQGKPEFASKNLLKASNLVTDKIDFKSIDSLVDRMFGTMALTYLELGKIPQSQAYFRKAINYSRKTGSLRQLGPLLLNMGLSHRIAQDIPTALQFYEEGVILAREIKDKGSEGSFHVALADLYIIYGDTEKAKIEYQKALTLFRIVGYRSGILTVLLNFANIAILQDMIDEAKSFYLKMIRLARRWQSVRYEMEAMGYLGILLYRHLNQRKDGRDNLQQAILLAHQLDNPRKESGWNYHIANLLAEVGKHEKAINIYEKELAFSKEIGDLDFERAINIKLAQAKHHLDHYHKAYPYIRQAVLLTDKLRRGSLLEQYKISFLEERIDIYELAVDICLALEKTDEALEYVEKSKSRALMDLVATTTIVPHSRGKKITDLILRESEILHQLRSMQNYDLFDLSSGLLRQMDRPANRYHTLLKKLDAIYIELRKVESQYVDIREGTTLSFKAICRSLLS